MAAEPGTANAMMYVKHLKITKGMRNQYRFEIQNQDQKSVNVLRKTLMWQLVDMEGEQVLIKALDTTRPGYAILTLDESETRALEDKFYRYIVTLADDLGNQVQMYSGLDYQVAGDVEVKVNDYPAHRESDELDTWNTEGSTFVTNPLQLAYDSEMVTIQVYTNGFTGIITVQASLTPTVESTNWSNVGTIDLTSATGTFYTTINGVFRNLRFSMPDSVTGTVTSVKVRY